MPASLKIDMGIIKIRHFLPDHIDNASLTSHCLIHIPKSDMAISRNGRLITDKIFDSGNGPEIAIIVFIFTVPHPAR